ncbi:MAG: GTPase HflX [Planctomycetales bacterium]|nr:GTPase HflX [Planctomycetales bacterium]
MREQLKVHQERAVLVGALLKADRKRNANQDDVLGELTALAESAGAVVVDRFIQRMSRIHAATYIGSGKAAQLADKVKAGAADTVIFDNDLSPGQIRELEKIVGVKVLDRSELILDIFATRAQTKQAKLQVELAQLEYTYPRLTRMWSHLDTVTGAAGGAGGAGAVGAIGTRGTGEKQLEIDRRLVSKRITDLKRDLADIDKRKMREIDGRREVYKISIVGYTNAGKSTLMNALTDAGVYVEDKLFATLDTRTRKWQPAPGVEALISDTVGFVSKLPHHLVASFKATLEETVNADLLLHVVDASSPHAFEQIKSVQTVLKELGCERKDMLVLLNKCDRIANRAVLESAQTVFPDAISVSAKTGLNLEMLAQRIAQKVRGGYVRVRITASAADGKLQSYLRTVGQGLQEEYLDGSVRIEATLGKNQIAQLGRVSACQIEYL